MQKKLKKSPATISAGSAPDSGSGGRTPAGAELRLIPTRNPLKPDNIAKPTTYYSTGSRI